MHSRFFAWFAVLESVAARALTGRCRDENVGQFLLMKRLFVFVHGLRVALLLSLLSICGAVSAGAVEVGVARIDVTPEEPIRLTGYASRQTNSIGVEQKLWAKAIAIGESDPAVMITLDNCGIAEETYREIVRRLGKSAKVKQARIAIACSHTHSGPCTTQWAPNIFVKDIAPEQQAVIDRYTQGLIAKLEEVTLAALKDRRPGKLGWSQGTVEFARNRRVVRGKAAQFGDNASGPVDHALPVLKFEDQNGALRAVVANYACHCTTLGGEVNHVCGDWAGYAQEAIERNHPGAMALISIGCGADANPAPRGGADGGLALAKKHGEELAAEVKRLLGLSFLPLDGKFTAKLKEIELPFDPHFTRAQWEERAKQAGIVGFHAKKQLAKLDRGEKLATKLYYPINTWSFGDQLTMVFLPGEVVVDYVLRLKEELDPTRLWVTAYANYVPCYIPSRRILAEGGYEAEDSLWYYDRPARLSPDVEDLIIKTTRELVPKTFQKLRRNAQLPDPKTPQQALAAFRTRADLAVELVASEPLVESPVALDWGADGRLWVCEMYDYPSGLDGKGKPGGRIKVLTDTNGDGRYDKAKLFLDGLAFPTGVMPWRNGALVCAAPDILYAEDTNGDGKADVVRTNFTGFATHNFQARVNGFTWGLDGWLHGSSGLFGGKIKSLLTGKTVDLSGRDFRLKPDTGEIEPVSGLSQMGRIRDDFDNWFGNDNSTLLWGYPLADHYLRRNPHVTYPEPRLNLAPNATKLFPISRMLERFNDPQAANRATSACGPGLYRDDLLGTAYYGNAFICEPVHNVVRRMLVEPDGVLFTARRAPEDEGGEFLSSTDNWFRPVQARTGPDGALWVVDMYRFVVEHPRWIPPERLKELDPRAGADKGRIYRVLPRNARSRPVPRVDRMTPAELALSTGSTNGVVRDLAHQRLTQLDEAGVKPAGQSSVVVDVLKQIAIASPLAAARVQALAVLGGARQLRPDVMEHSLADADPQVRRAALRWTEPMLAKGEWSPGVSAALERLAADPVAVVRLQLALSVGEWKDPAAAALLAKLAAPNDRWLRAAVLSSSSRFPGELFTAMMSVPDAGDFCQALVSGAVSSGKLTSILKPMIEFTDPVARGTRQPEVGEIRTVAGFLDALERRGADWQTSLRRGDNTRSASERADVAGLIRRLEEFTAATRRLVEPGDVTAVATNRAELRRKISGVALLGRSSGELKRDVAAMAGWLTQGLPTELSDALIDRMSRLEATVVAGEVLERWNGYSPAVRTAVLNRLLSREDGTMAVLDGVDRGVVRASEIPLTARPRLLKHENAAIRTRSAKLFEQSSTRSAVIGNYAGVGSLSGVAERGVAVFDKNCAQCHAMRGHGHAVGPNLGEFAGKSVADFVTAIFDPNAAINPNFTAYNVETKDGRSLTGVVRGETASGLTLVQGGGAEETILRSALQEMRASQLSLMPEGLEQAMAPQDVADLIAWIKSAGPAGFGSATPEKATRAREQFLANGVNGVSKIVAAGGQTPYASWLGQWPMGFCRQDEGMNRVTWQSAPVPKDFKPEGTWSFRLPIGMGFLSQPAGRFTLRLNGEAKIDFDVSLTDRTWLSADGQVRMNYTVMEANAEDSNGVLVIETAGKFLQPGEPVTWEVVGSGARSQRWFGIYLVGNR